MQIPIFLTDGYVISFYQHYPILLYYYYKTTQTNFNFKNSYRGCTIFWRCKPSTNLLLSRYSMLVRSLAIRAGELTYIASSTLNNKNLLSFYHNYYKSQVLKNKENYYNANTAQSIILQF